MYEALSKIADRAFIIGFVLPTLLGAFLLIALFGTSVPFLGTMAKSVESSQKLVDLTYFAVGVWVISVLLSALNYSFYRILEGYVFPLPWLRFPRRLQLKRYRRLLARRKRLERERMRMERFPKEKEAELERLIRKLVRRYPGDQQFILPSSFGNTIRAFEYYPVAVYGVDSIAMWPRLASVISSTFGDALNNSRALVDFMVNCFFISIAFLAYALVDLMVSLTTAMVPWQMPVVLAIAMLLVATVTYFGAVDAAVAWGDSVKSAFDCYLPALVDQLAFDVSPDPTQRREFWTSFSQQALYNIPLDSPKWKFKQKK